jgi:dolichol-phosphate mannosyltransferase
LNAVESTLVVLPSYNERSNIMELIDLILVVDSRIRVCVVDDASPDGTSEAVEEALAVESRWAQDRVHLLVRSGKEGRGGAVRAGFIWGLADWQQFDSFVEMDCDFSHSPSELPTGLNLLAAGNDVLVGSRYPDGTISGWPLHRRVFSRLSNLFARFLLVWSIPDYTNGFRFYSRAAVKLLAEQPIENKGFIYLSESLARLLRGGFKVRSFPTAFANRRSGKSSTGIAEITSAFAGIIQVAWWFHVSSRWHAK